jgi:predicted ArsR family transcriptional regulator
MIHELPLFDITARKHRGAETSIAANLTTNKVRDTQRIRLYIESRGRTYLKEVVRELRMPVQTVSARLADLKSTGVIEVVKDETGHVERQEGCALVQMCK